MNRKLILHIGSHKTGSTSIQSHLLIHRAKLKQNGWDLFCTQPDGKQSSVGNANTWVSFSGMGKSFKATVNPNVFAYLAKTSDNIVFSAEELFWLDDPLNIRHFVTGLANIFTEIKVACYLRRQDKHLLSHFQQGFKQPSSSATRFYGHNLCVVPEHQEHYSRYLDYHQKLSLWKSCVGIENIDAREFDENKLANNDAVSDFLTFLPFLQATKNPGSFANESNNLVQSILVHSIQKVRPELLLDLDYEKFLQEEMFRYSIKPKLTRNESQKVLDIYRQSNCRLKEYIPDLSSSWTGSENAQELDITSSQIGAREYQHALQAVLRYYDDMPIIKFVTLRMKQMLRKYGIKKGLK